MPVLTLCGSGKFRDEVFASAQHLSDHGFTVLAPPLHRFDLLLQDQVEELHQLAWKGATLAHFGRIAKCDGLYLVNPTGYVGVSTTLELGYGYALGKIVIAMQPDPEPARSTLFDLVLETEDVRKAAATTAAHFNL